MLRRLHPDQPDTFGFTKANLKWAEAQITKFPEGRQASAIIPLLWRAQEQEGWLSRPAIEHVADMLGMAHIRALEVATFYFMFQLQPVGSVAHIQVCGTLSCMICGAEDLIAVCQDKIAPKPHQLSADGKFSWEEVECLGSCANAPMAQIGKDYYEDLTTDRLAAIIDELAVGKVPVPGPQNGRYAAEPLAGLTSLTEYESGRTQYNASVELAVDLGDTIKRIDGTEVPLLTPWLGKSAKSAKSAKPAAPSKARKAAEPKPSKTAPADVTGITKQQARENSKAKPVSPSDPKSPRKMKAPRKSGADDLKKIKGVGPKLEQMLHQLGFFHYDQVAKWTPAEVAWVDENLEGFKGRVSRDGWVEQAKVLAAGGETEFSKRAKY
ncbi:MAG: NADH-quinone oxidoreductase subunit E [Paracoccaceae bacterium]